MTRPGAVTAGQDHDPGRAQDTVTGSPAAAHPDDAVAARIRDILAVFLAERRHQAEAIDPAFGAAVGSLADFVLGGGKRIRPIFAWWGWRGAGGDPDDPIASALLQSISALELIQGCALIHDDLMDASATRRGGPTVHVSFAEQHGAAGWAGRSERFGAAGAILLGDLALAWADDMFHGAALPPAVALGAAAVWQAMRTEMLGGQYLDVLAQATGDPSGRAALRVNRYKTAAYTVERPLQLGAVIARAPEHLVTAYRRFGADLGVAFQLRDDLLGVFGDRAVTGKPAGDDLREGKRTWLVAVALQRAAESGESGAAEVLRRALGDESLDQEGLDRVRAVLTEGGALQAVERRIDELTSSALDALGGAPVAEPAATRLAELAIAATRRRC